MCIPTGWFRSASSCRRGWAIPSRTAYRYLQHFIQHPALWRYLKDGTLRSWGAKSLEESGRRGEPFLTGNGYARIGEGSGSTNMLTGSAWMRRGPPACNLREAVIELLRAGKPFTQQNLARPTWRGGAPVGWRAAAREAEDARNGFHGGMCAAWSAWRWPASRAASSHLKPKLLPAHSRSSALRRPPKPEAAERSAPRIWCIEDGRPLHDALLTRARLARNSVRRPLLVIAAGCAADGRQSAGHARLRRSCGLSRSCASAPPATKKPASPCAPARPSRWAPRTCPLRTREMRALRRLRVELRQIRRRQRTTISSSGGSGRTSFGGELRYNIESSGPSV